MKRIILKCCHPDVAVKCEYKNWAYIPGKEKAVRICEYTGRNRGNCVKTGGRR